MYGHYGYDAETYVDNSVESDNSANNTDDVDGQYAASDTDDVDGQYAANHTDDDDGQYAAYHTHDDDGQYAANHTDNDDGQYAAYHTDDLGEASSTPSSSRLQATRPSTPLPINTFSITPKQPKTTPVLLPICLSGKRNWKYKKEDPAVRDFVNNSPVNSPLPKKRRIQPRNIFEIFGIALENQPDVTELPVAVPRGSFKPVAIDSQQQPTFIMFDLETTDLIQGVTMPHITQVAAVEPQSNERFNIYVKPKVPVSFMAELITGIEVSDSGNMSVHGKAVKFTSITAAAKAFNAWVSRFQNVVLVAHNGRRFDFPVYVSMLESIGAFEVFCDKVIGFIDSLRVFKMVYPKEKSYKQVALVRKFLPTSYSAHDAMEDVIALGHLFLHSNCSSEFLLKHSFSPKAVYNQRLFNREKYNNIGSLSPLIEAGVMKRPTAENIAGSGLNLNHLRVIFRRNGEVGLHNSFTVKNSEGLPRVTNTKRVLENVIPKLGVFFNNEKT